MGLDVYVGSLTRYLAHDWKTIMQQAGEAQGMQVVVDRPTVPDAITDKESIRETVVGWRRLIEHGLKGRLRGPLEWDESDSAVESVVWHFFTSPVTGKLGPSETLLQLLNKHGIDVIFHP